MVGGDMPKRPPTAQEKVLAELRRLLAGGVLAPGEQVRQDALAERVGTSRVPLREALKILEGEGLVTYQPHRGYFVATLSQADLDECFRLRALLEDEAVSAALPLVRDSDLLEMEQALADAAAATDPLAVIAAHRRFHFVLIERSGLLRCTRWLGTLWDATEHFRRLVMEDPLQREAAAAEHRAILATVRDRDLPRTLSLLRAHRAEGGRRLASHTRG